MTWPTIFANLAGGNQPLSLFDTMFNQVAQMVAIPSTASGVNAISLTPIGSAPALPNYQNFSSFRFVAAATSTGLVTAQYQALGFLNVYLADGLTQAGSGNIIINQEYVLVFAQFLNGGAGGFFLEAASVPAIVAVAGSALTNLVINCATGSSQAVTTYDELVMNNPAGAAIRAVSQSFSINPAVNGVNGLDTGTQIANTWYAVWGISNGSTAAGLLSLSFTNPTMPVGYTYKKRIGAVRSAGVAPSLFASLQQQREANYVVGAGGFVTTPNFANNVAGTFSLTSPTLVNVQVRGAGNFLAPPTAIRVGVIATGTAGGLTAANVLVAPNVNWGGTNNGPQGSNEVGYPIWIPATSGSQSAWMNLESNNIAWCSSAAGGSIGSLGWTDNI